MLVNLGLTADAAAIHRHEFSAHQSGRSTTPTISQVSNSILSLGFMPSGVRNLVPGNGASRPAPSGRASPSDPYSPLDNEQRNSFDVHGELVAVLGQSRKEGSKSKGLVDICIDQGGLWEATPISNNVYEFTHTGENGLRKCVRWVLRGKENRNSMGLGAGGEQDGKRYIFSMIDPTSRRHPVIAWMTRNGIDVLDRYSLTSGSTRSRSASISAPSSNAKLSTPVSDRNVTETEDWLRTLIIVTGIWVALREGWSRYPASSDIRHTTPRSRSTNTQSTQSQQLRMSEFDGNVSEMGMATQTGCRPSFQSARVRMRQDSLHVHTDPPFPAHRQGLKSIDSEKPAPRKVSKERRRKRHRILCMGSETSSPPDSPHPPGIPSRGTPGRPRGRHQGLLDAGLTEYDDQDAGHPSHVSHSPRKSDSAKRRKWCGLAFWIDSVGTKTRKKAR
ncbi:hypothetical protein CIHG_06750 [Coccidioides immitis H538.4]|uniref:Uncharacterized protein n=1 Tax=Coccidioides immitis H538.4 TaxID=396776 RepID=A0A0J8RXN8_COCIT|nr:hypothetical protein CIHG_06750 [Coccidioides immitis H538.4]